MWYVCVCECLTSTLVSCCCAAGEKAIVCDQCGAQFQTEESLEAHRQIHTGMNTHSQTYHDDTIDINKSIQAPLQLPRHVCVG